MTPGHDLFNIIHSLTMSEKRYFKLTLSQRVGRKGRNYQILFDEVDRQGTYNEKEIRHALKGKVSNFTATKHQLYNILLASLRAFHSRNAGENILYEQLRNIEILFNRGLYRECSQMVKKARKVSKLYENRLISLELNNWEVRLMREMKYEHTSPGKLEELYHSDLELIDQLRVLSDCRYNANKFFRNHLRHAYVRSRDSAQQLRSMLDFSLLRKKNIPILGRIILYFTVAGYYISVGDFKQCYRYNKQLIALLESISHQTSEVQRYYVNALINMCVILREMNSHKELQENLHKLSSLSVKNENLSVAVACFIYYNKGDMLLQKGDFASAVKLADEITDYIRRTRSKIDNATLQVLQYMIAYTYFGDGKYPRAMEWTRMIINDHNTDRRMDIFHAARLLYILSHMDKGNYDVAAYLGKSFNRVFGKEEHGYHIEKELIDFIKQLKKISQVPDSSKKTLREAFISFRCKAEIILKDPFEKRLLDYIDLFSWLDARIDNKPFAEVVQRRAS